MAGADFNQQQQQLSMINAMLMQNMAMAGTNTPFANTTYIRPMPPMAQTGFGSFVNLLQGFSPELGGLAAAFGPMLAQANIPGITPFVRGMMQSAPLGGSYDPTRLMLANLQAQSSYSMPMYQLPTAYYGGPAAMQQLQAYNQQAASINKMNNGLPGFIPMPTLKPVDGADEATNMLYALQNSDAVISRNSAAAKLARLYDITAPQGITSNIEAMVAGGDIAGFRTALQNPNVRRAVEHRLNNRGKAGSWSNNLEFLNNFRTSNPMLADATEGLIDIISDSMGLDSELSLRRSGLGSLNAMGTLGLQRLSATGVQPLEMASGRIMGGLIEQIKAGRYGGLKEIGLARSGDLMAELGQAGLLSAGSMDVYGNLKRDDVNKLGDMLGQQLEAFSELVKLGRKLKMSTHDLLSHLQGAFSGDVLGAIQRAGGGSAGMSRILYNLGTGNEMAAMVGLDPAASMGLTSTAAQMLRGIGFTGTDYAQTMSNNAMSMMAVSRSIGRPMSLAESMNSELNIMRATVTNTDSSMRMRVMQMQKDGYLSDAAAQALLSQPRLDAQDVATAVQSGAFGSSPVLLNYVMGDEYSRKALSDSAIVKAGRQSALLNPVTGLVAERLIAAGLGGSLQQSITAVPAQIRGLLGARAGSMPEEALLALADVDRNELVQQMTNAGMSAGEQGTLLAVRESMLTAEPGPDGTGTISPARVAMRRAVAEARGADPLMEAESRQLLAHVVGGVLAFDRSTRISDAISATHKRRIADFVKARAGTPQAVTEQEASIILAGDQDSLPMMELLKAAATGETDASKLAMLSKARQTLLDMQGGRFKGPTQDQRVIGRTLELIDMVTDSSISPESKTRMLEEIEQATKPAADRAEQSTSSLQTNAPGTSNAASAKITVDDGIQKKMEDAVGLLGSINTALQNMGKTPVMLSGVN